ncbi:MAG: dihydropteroate synthase [Prevotellaceae bacterium]|nr:dihydropteroate synthase [Prevotellaceae bacterium]
MAKFSPFYLTIHGQRQQFDEPVVMGILNATPDSFFAGSRKQTEAEIADRANAIISEGGVMIDVGACSTRPGGIVVDEAEELARMRHALEIVRREQPDAILSIDTFRPSVALMAIEEFGADIINDISEGEVFVPGDDTLLDTMRSAHTGYILMSQQPTMETTAELFREKVEFLTSKGIQDIILDPGYGFGKDIAQNYAMLKEQSQLETFGLPVLAGVSRKRMIFQLLGTSPAEALNGTTVVNAIALMEGADILRVHDVREAVEAVRIHSSLFTFNP